MVSSNMVVILDQWRHVATDQMLVLSQNSCVDILIPKDSGILRGRAFENHDSGDLMNSVSAF